MALGPLAAKLRRRRLGPVAAIAFAALVLAPAASADLLPVGVPLETALPAVSGVAQAGQTVSCLPGAWTGSPTSYVYSWQRDGADIAGATGSTYTLAAGDVGQAVTCTVAAANGLGLGAPAISLPILPVTPPGLPVPLDLTLPAIAGSPQLGQTVTCSPGTWTGDPTSYVYSWQRSGATIPGAVGSTYTLAAADVGQAITCAVTAVNGVGSSLPVGSLPVVPLAPSSLPVPVATGLPAISGNPAVGHTLTCSSGSWSNDPTSYTYAWQRTGAILSGATGSTYGPTASDLAQAISCIVVAHNASGNSAPGISLPVVPFAVGTGGTGGRGSGGGKRGTPKLLAPTVKSLSVSPGRMTIIVKGKRQTTPGTTFRFTIDKTAGVLIYVERRLVGRVNGRSCAATTTRNAGARHCTRYVRVAGFAVKNAKAGAHTVKYRGRLGKGLVGSGNYAVFAAAANSAGWSKLKSANFAVTRKHVRVRGRRPARHRR